MYVIYKDFGMLTGQTSLPPDQPTGLKVNDVHNFSFFSTNLIETLDTVSKLKYSKYVCGIKKISVC